LHIGFGIAFIRACIDPVLEGSRAACPATTRQEARLFQWLADGRVTCNIQCHGGCDRLIDVRIAPGRMSASALSAPNAAPQVL
jgi:hypothetical protein